MGRSTQPGPENRKRGNTPEHNSEDHGNRMTLISQRRQERMRKAARTRQLDLQVVVEDVHDPHNVSAILRTCDALGVQTVNLVYTAQHFPELSRKVSGHSLKWLTLRRFESVEECLTQLRSEGLQTHATAMGATPHLEVDWTQPAAIVFGNEHSGCSEEMIRQCGSAVAVPMVGMAESLNVSVAAGICLAEAVRQRAAAKGGKGWTAGRKQLLEQWLERERRRVLRADRRQE